MAASQIASMQSLLHEVSSLPLANKCVQTKEYRRPSVLIDRDRRLDLNCKCSNTHQRGQAQTNRLTSFLCAIVLELISRCLRLIRKHRFFIVSSMRFATYHPLCKHIARMSNQIAFSHSVFSFAHATNEWLSCVFVSSCFMEAPIFRSPTVTSHPWNMAFVHCRTPRMHS